MPPHAATLPPEKELRQREEELARLEQELAEEELLLSTAKGELHLFEKSYNQVVGAKFAEFDEIRAQILELAARFDPRQEKLRTDAQTARDEADQSARESKQTPDPPKEKTFHPSEELRKLFRDAAKRIHPDLTTDKEERERRHQLMARLNQAYDELDQAKIESILQEWEEKGHPKDELSIGARLVQKSRQIGQVKTRLKKIRADLEQLENSEMFKLKEKVEQMKKYDRDVVREIAADIDKKIARVKNRLLELAGELIHL
ncbi:MAG: hypothetical protein ACE5GQ_04935 [Nitrospinales bacterium]